MEGKQVPWWRKALNIALSGIRSGFGLFSRTPKHIDEIEPETIAGHKEIRVETQLTELSPELNSIEVEAENQIEAAGATNAANVAAHESTAKAESVIEAPPAETPAPEPVVEVEAEVVESAPEPIFEAEASIEAEVVSAPEEASSDVEPESEEAAAEPESVIEPVMQSDVIASDNVVEAEPAEELEAEEEENAAPAEDGRANDVPAEAEEVQEADAVPETTIEASAEVADPEPAADKQVAAEQVAAEPETPVQEPPLNPAIEDGFEQVTEQQVTVENVIVDEVAPQPESEIGEDLTPQSVSPVQDELVEPETQASEESNEPVEMLASGAVVLNEKETLQEVDAVALAEEHIVEPSEMVDQNLEQVTDEVDQQLSDQEVTDQEVADQESADQAIEQPMDLNHSNPEPEALEPDAEHEQAAETATPVSEEAAVVDEPAAPAAVATAPQHPSKPFIKLEAKEGEVNASPFSVTVSQVYDGPLDLLLDLIRKQDIDIYDIPIARITAQFLAYVNQLKAGDVDVAGEFIYTASLLIHIKSKMLLPRAPSGPDDAAEDPRRELVERLLEHERFKNAAQMLQQKQMLEAATWTNPGVRDFKEDVGSEPEIAADTVDLVRVFREILERARNRPILKVEEDSVTVGQMIQFLSRRLSMEDKPVALRKLLSHSRSERALIAMFLALLELVRLQAILLRQDIAFSEIFIKKHSNFESVMNESVVHDDWK
jgi:segregation and condensation protein A